MLRRSCMQGEAAALQGAVGALADCLERPDGCRVVPGLPIEQYYATLTCSVAGGLVAGFVSKIEPQGEWLGLVAVSQGQALAAWEARGTCQTTVQTAKVRSDACTTALAPCCCRYRAAALGVAAAVLAAVGQSVCQLWPRPHRVADRGCGAHCSQHSSLPGGSIPAKGVAAAVGWGRHAAATLNDRQ